jgi:Ca2+-binding RTX toxin-like protein
MMRGDLSVQTIGNVTNDGTMNNVFVGGGSTTYNSGHITGDVVFGDGINTFIGVHGTVDGHVIGGAGLDFLLGGSDDDYLYGSGGADQLRGVRGDDMLSGGGGKDLLDGGGGDDTIGGGSGKDTITGGAGDDVLTGGADGDKFIFGTVFGHDTITGFKAGSAADHDVIAFAPGDFDNFADLKHHMVQIGDDVVITLNANNALILDHVVLTKLVAADFLFT